MKALKVMSIIGLIILCFCLAAMSATPDGNRAAVFGALAIIYAIPYTIVGLVQSTKSKNVADEIIKMYTLKEKGIITEEEFNIRKQKIINS